MKIPLTLNGEKKIIEAESDEYLRDVLRRENCTSVKCGCGEGICGCCTILLDGKPVPSCKIPAGIIRDNEIITLEHFSTQELYNDIIKGFSKAGISLCGFCNAGKIFVASNIIKKFVRPTRQNIDSEVEFLAPCCTDKNTLINGIIYASEFYFRRMGAMKNAR